MEKAQENSKSFIVLGNGRLALRSHEFSVCGTEACAIESEKTIRGLDGFEVDIQSLAVNAGLQLAHAISSARGRLGKLAGLGVLFNIPRGLNEIDALSPEYMRLHEGGSRKHFERRALPTAGDFVDTIRDKYLKFLNGFNLENGAQFELRDISVLTDQRAKNEIIRMLKGEEGYPCIGSIGPSELSLVCQNVDGEVCVTDAGVHAASNWVFSQNSGGADIYQAIMADEGGRNSSSRVRGASFSRKYLGVGKVSDRLISDRIISYVAQDGDSSLASRSLWSIVG